MNTFQGFGKVILLGEHAVVYDRPALVSALDHGVRATTLPARDRELLLEPVEGSAAHTPLYNQAFEALCNAYSTSPKPTRIRLHIDIPQGAGLGCSAAMGVAIVRALDAQAQLDRSAQQIAQASLAWERIFHGTPSGIDSAAAAMGGLLTFQKSQGAQPLFAQKALHLVVAHSGQSSNTRSTVESVARQRVDNPKRLDKVFDGIAALVEQATRSITDGDLSTLGECMNLNHGLLSSLLLSTTALEQMCETARREGAFGAKLTGAGGGGCMLALARDSDHAQHLAQSLGKDAFTLSV